MDDKKPADPDTAVPLTDRLGVPLHLGDRLLFPPSPSTPMIMDLIEVAPALDPSMPPGTLRVRCMMQMFAAVPTGGALPAYKVGMEEPQPAAPAPRGNLIVVPGGKH